MTQEKAQATPPQPPIGMRVSLAFVDHRVNVWLRFGKPVRETRLDRWRRIAVFRPGAVCCRIKWLGNDYGTALWQLMVLQAPMTANAQQADTQRISGVQPSARILLRADGQKPVKDVLGLIDGIEALGLDPAKVAVTYWRMVGNRLAARQPLPDYTTERHAAHLARGALQ
jgi:Protein of unknown function (DUF2840)